eukprot:gene17967-25142_t
MSKHKNDLAIIEHAIQVADYHGGSFNLKDAFRHIKHFLSGEKKGRKKEQKLQEPNDYAKEHFGFDPKEKKPKPAKKEEYTYEEVPKSKPKPKPKPKPKKEYEFDDDDTYGYQQQKPKPPPPQPASHPHEHHYATLGLTSSATPQEVTKAFRKKLALVHHPDKNVGNEEQAAEQFKKINNAYMALTGRGFKERKKI